MEVESRSSLKYVTDELPGYRRKKHGRGHKYFDPNGQKIDKKILEERLEALAIPPMWEDVWICTYLNGHLQATGYDEKGRKQYIYHPDWVAFRNANKFSKLVQFGKKLPLIRKQVQADLKKKDWVKEKVLALVVSVLDDSFLRIGNKAYLEENNTYGLTTLRRRHLQVNGKEAVLKYKAKSGKEREVSIENKELVKLIKQCSDLPGYEIFRYKEGSSSQIIDSEDVNDYLQEIAGEEFSSKDFRTWGGTVTAVEEFENALQEVEENPRKNLLSALVQRVAARLGNTPAVCREYYIHPAILLAAEEGILQQTLSRSRFQQQDKYDLTKNEKITLRLLQEYEKENQLEPVIVKQ